MKQFNLTTKKHSLALLGIALFGLTLLGSVSISQSAIVHGQTTDIRVWVADEDEIYPSIDDVVFYIRAARGCHALVYIVDTDGYIHVLHPFSMYEDSWVEGGVTYRITAREAGLYGFDYDRGIAFVYAVGSPYPFEYSAYGADIFAGRYSYRIYGDPFIACKRFYVSLLPSWCDRAFIGVSFSHFYVREWVRYPRYLCVNHAWSYHGHGYCSQCSNVYDRYRVHMRDPYRVLHPTVRYKSGTKDYARIATVSREHSESLRAKRNRNYEPIKVAHRSTTGRSLKNKQIRTKSETPKVKQMHRSDRPVKTKSITTKNRVMTTPRSTKKATKTTVRKPAVRKSTQPSRTKAIKQHNGKTQKKSSQAVKTQSRSKSGRVISKASQVKKSSRSSNSKSSQKARRNNGR